MSTCGGAGERVEDKEEMEFEYKKAQITVSSTSKEQKPHPHIDNLCCFLKRYGFFQIPLDSRHTQFRLLCNLNCNIATLFRVSNIEVMFV